MSVQMKRSVSLFGKSPTRVLYVHLDCWHQQRTDCTSIDFSHSFTLPLHRCRMKFSNCSSDWCNQRDWSQHEANCEVSTATSLIRPIEYPNRQILCTYQNIPWFYSWKRFCSGTKSNQGEWYLEHRRMPTQRIWSWEVHRSYHDAVGLQSQWTIQGSYDLPLGSTQKRTSPGDLPMARERLNWDLEIHKGTNV